MRITAYIANYNDGDTLPRAIVSAVSQPLIEEVVVIDDCSTDDSLDICRYFEAQNPGKFRFVRHERKSESWIEAAAALFPTFRGTHIASIGASDLFLETYSPSLAKLDDPPIAFGGYGIIDTSCTPTARVAVCDADRTLSPAEVVAEVVDLAVPQRETGISSIIRRDCLQWLCDLRFWEAGPWCDSVGYAAVAMRYGATYTTDLLTCFEHDPDGYGGREREGERRFLYAKGAVDFLIRAGFDLKVVIPLLAKRGINVST